MKKIIVLMILFGIAFGASLFLLPKNKLEKEQTSTYYLGSQDLEIPLYKWKGKVTL